MNESTLPPCWWRRGHGPRFMLLVLLPTLLLALPACKTTKEEVTVPGDERLLAGSYSGSLSPWPNPEGRLEFTVELEAQWYTEGSYIVSGDLITSAGAEHPLTATVGAYPKWIFVPAPDTTLGPAAPPPLRYDMSGRIPSLGISFCAREYSASNSWGGPAWVSTEEDVSSGRCGDQFSFRLEQVEPDP